MRITTVNLLFIHLILLLQVLRVILLGINSDDLLLFLILEKATEKLTSHGKGHRLCPLHSVETIVWLSKIKLLLLLLL